MAVTEAEMALIQDELRTTKDYSKIARRLGLPVRAIRELDIDTNGRFKTSDDGLGRPELRKFIVATRHVDSYWPEDEAVAKAKQDYDAGLAEVCSARDGFTQILYCIPRKVVDKDRVPYFSRRFGD